MSKKHVLNKFSQAAGAGLVARFAADGVTPAVVYIPLFPASPFRTQDSRSGIEFSYDLATLRAASFKNGKKLPFDIEHNTERGTACDTRARGWIVDVTDAASTPDAGLQEGFSYSVVELNELGQQEYAAKFYGYTSPVAQGVWLDESHILFTRLKSNTWTNNPANDLPMAFTAEDESQEAALDAATTAAEAEMNLLQALIARLGLAAESTAEQVEAAVTALTEAKTASDTAQASFTTQLTAAQTETSTFKAQVDTLTAQVTTLTADLATAKTALTAAQAAEAERQVFAAVDAAIAARKATPAQRDSLLPLARADLVAFTAAMAAAPDVLSGGAPAPRAAAGTDDTYGLTAEQIATAKAAGVSLQSFAHALSAAQAQLGL